MDDTQETLSEVIDKAVESYKAQARPYGTLCADFPLSLKNFLRFHHASGSFLASDMTPETADEIIAKLAPIAFHFTALKPSSPRMLHLKDAHFPALIKLAGALPNLNELDLADCNLTNASLPLLCDFVRSNPNLRYLYLDFNRFTGEEAGKMLAALLDDAPHLEELILCEMPLGDKGLEPILQALARNTGLRGLHISGCGESSATIDLLAETMRTNRTLSSLSVNASFALDTLQAAIEDNDNMNLWQLNTDIQRFSYDTNLRMHHLSPKLDTPESLSFHEHALLETRRSTLLAASATRGPREEALRGYYRWVESTLPGLPEKGAPLPDALFTPDANGYAPLDNPRIWREHNALFDLLDAAGVTLTPELLERKTPRGLRFIDAAVCAAPLGELIARLQPLGRGIRSGELLEADDSMNMAYTLLMEGGLLPRLFLPENWRNASPYDLARTYRAIPAEDRWPIKNYHMLHTELSASFSQGRGR